MPGPEANAQPELLIAPAYSSDALYKPLVIGLYGVPGCGKSHMLNQLKQKLDEKDFAFFEGSEVIGSLVYGGLSAFKKYDTPSKDIVRMNAIHEIKTECIEQKKAGVVTGHFMFWNEGKDSGLLVYTWSDFDVFTHIMYLKTPEDVIEQRRQNDKERNRPTTSAEHLRKWQQTEINQIQALCAENSVIFRIVPPLHLNTLHQHLKSVKRFHSLTEQGNLEVAKSRLDEAVGTLQNDLGTTLVLDADKTLAAEDASELFWKTIALYQRPGSEQNPLKKLHASAEEYSYDTFRNATLLYETAVPDVKFDSLCEEVASKVSMYPEIVSLLQLVAEQEHLSAAVVTSGLRLVWEKVLEREGLSDTVKVIGGGRIADVLVVDPEVKAELVSHLQGTHKRVVWAFGDSPVDLKMLRRANKAVVVVGHKETRSTTMDAALQKAIAKGELHNPSQALLPSTASPRLDPTTLPLVELTKQAFVDAIVRHRNPRRKPHILDATNTNAANILMTATRNADSEGAALRDAHNRVGRYLALQFVPDVIGVEKYPVPHVLGTTTFGYRLFHEHETTIVALMRGGEPMALGVSDVCPRAMFVHAARRDNLKLYHLQGRLVVILVDSVINSGDTMVQFVKHVRSLHATIRIVMVTGVVQAQAVKEGRLYQELTSQPKLSLVALRRSENMYPGKGSTDTGNRLFNTKHLD